MLRGILLDIDGTLLLSNDAHARAWVAAFANHGYAVSFDRVRSLIGMGGDKLLPAIVPGLSDQQGEGKQIADERKTLFRQRELADLQPAPGARELVERLDRAGLKLVVASSASGDELDSLLQAARVDDLIDTATTSSDAKESKPDPDIVAAALDRSDLRAEEVLMIGDTPYDVESAARCGVGLIAVRCGGWDDDRLDGALAIYDDPADLLAHWRESPLDQPAESAGD